MKTGYLHMFAPGPTAANRSDLLGICEITSGRILLSYNSDAIMKAAKRHMH